MGNFSGFGGRLGRVGLSSSLLDAELGFGLLLPIFRDEVLGVFTEGSGGVLYINLAATYRLSAGSQVLCSGPYPFHETRSNSQ